MTPQKAAWYQTTEAIRKGELTRPEACACSATVGSEAHHDDYAKPLDVTWLCRTCHRARHRELGHTPRLQRRNGPAGLNPESVRSALVQTAGSVTDAASLLNVSRSAVHVAMRKFGIEVQRIVA